MKFFPLYLFVFLSCACFCCAMALRMLSRKNPVASGKKSSFRSRKSLRQNCRWT